MRKELITGIDSIDAAGKQILDEVTDLIDLLNSTGQYSAAEITRCPVCREWKIPRYDSKTNRVTRKHVCPGPNPASEN